jgi:Fe-S cluster biogenesis protein NfuA
MPFEQRFINGDGECVVCHEHRKKWLNRDYERAEQELIRILEHYKLRNRHRKYDALVGFSGGKDSVYALYLLKNKYGMRPLAVTADNGLLTERSLRNMKTVVEKLGVDHVIVRRDQDELQSLYRAYFRKTKNFCEICYLTITSCLGQVAIEHDVPLMVTGFAFKVDSSHFRAARRYCFEDAFVRVVKDSIPEQVYRSYVTKDVRAENHFHLLHLFDYVNHRDDEIYRLLEDELGWDGADRKDKHTDCRFHQMIGYLRWINNDLTSLALMTPAALLRDGQITVEQFEKMRKDEEKLFQDVDPAVVKDFLEYFDVDEAFLKAALPPIELSEPVIGEEDFEPLVAAKRSGKNSDSELVEMLLSIIKPELARDGGDIERIEFTGNHLKVRLIGGCRGCTIGDQVMMRYIEHLIRTYISPHIIVEHVKELAPEERVGMSGAATQPRDKRVKETAATTGAAVHQHARRARRTDAQ